MEISPDASPAQPLSTRVACDVPQKQQRQRKKVEALFSRIRSACVGCACGSLCSAFPFLWSGFLALALKTRGPGSLLAIMLGEATAQIGAFELDDGRSKLFCT
jgi:hypothetical protein